MNKLLFIVTLIDVLISSVFIDFRGTSEHSITSVATEKDTVYICDGKTAYTYHKTQFCSGLSTCTHGVYKVFLKMLKNVYGRRARKVYYCL